MNHRETEAYQRNHDSYVCSGIEFAEEAQAPFALLIRFPQATSSLLTCAGYNDAVESAVVFSNDYELRDINRFAYLKIDLKEEKGTTGNNQVPMRRMSSSWP